MFERLDQLEARYEELTQALASPEVINDSAKYQKTAKAHSELTDIVEKYREYKDLTRGIVESKAVLADEKDPDMRAYAQEELTKLEERVGKVEEELKVLLIPKDPAPGATRPRSSLTKCFACIRATPSRRDGKSKCSRHLSLPWVA
jgi:peptide chain release factor 1